MFYIKATTHWPMQLQLLVTSKGHNVHYTQQHMSICRFVKKTLSGNYDQQGMNVFSRFHGLSCFTQGGIFNLMLAVW